MSTQVDHRGLQWFSGAWVIALVVLGGGVVVSGCQDERLLRPSGPRSLESLRALDGSDLTIRRDEAAFAELAVRLPGSAGFYLDRDGQLIVVVDAIGDLAGAPTAMMTTVATTGITDLRVRNAPVVARRAEYSFVELASWRDIVFGHLLTSEQGLTSLDLDERVNRVVIGISPDYFSAVRRALPEKLAALGVDTAAVSYRQEQLQQTGGVVNERAQVSMAAGGSVTLSSTFGAMVGGIQVEGSEGLCTIGVVADRGAVRGVVTASHCSEQKWAMDGSALYQPAASRKIGDEHTDPTPSLCGFPLPVDECRASDASFYSTLSTISSHRGLIARTKYSAGPNSGYGSLEIDTLRPNFFVGGVAVSAGIVGQRLHKIGRTSGWTWGEITNTCKDQNHHGWPNTKVTTCGYEVDFTNDPGDSGAPVFAFWGPEASQLGDIVTLFGLVVGNSSDTTRTIVGKWSGVVTDLGSLEVTAAATLPQPALSGSMIVTAPSLSWSAVAGATRYGIFRVTNGDTLVLAPTSSTSFADGSTNVLEYVGASEPTSGTKVGYSIYAFSSTELSARSNVIWYRGASGTFSVVIDGPDVVGPNNFDCSVWTAQATGASGPLSYSWSGFFTGSDSYVQGTIPTSGAEFQVLIVDSQGRQGGLIRQVTYDPNNSDYCI